MPSCCLTVYFFQFTSKSHLQLIFMLFSRGPGLRLLLTKRYTLDTAALTLKNILLLYLFLYVYVFVCICESGCEYECTMVHVGVSSLLVGSKHWTQVVSLTMKCLCLVPNNTYFSCNPPWPIVQSQSCHLWSNHVDVALF